MKHSYMLGDISSLHREMFKLYADVKASTCKITFTVTDHLLPELKVFAKYI